jgi:hypothetical protein
VSNLWSDSTGEDFTKQAGAPSWDWVLYQAEVLNKKTCSPCDCAILQGFRRGARATTTLGGAIKLLPLSADP